MTRKLIYSMMVSLDGFVETTDHKLDWVVVDEELHTFANDQAREMGAFIYGKGLYKAMVDYWPTADADPSAPGYIVDFARIWRDKPKYVFSKSLEGVDWNSTLVGGGIAEQIAKLKEERGDDLEISGATIAASALKLGLVDELRPIVHPVVLGAGTPFLPALASKIDLKLLETRVFGSGVIYLRYERGSVS